MKVTSIHFNPQEKPSLKHNDRTDNRAPNIYKHLSHNNECNRTAQEARELIEKYYGEALEILTAKKTKRKTEKHRSYTEAIVEIQEHHTMQDLEELSEEIEEITGFRTLQISIHRDEGHTDEHGEFKLHHHAHIVFFTLDKVTGKQLARQQASLSKENLKKMQTITAQKLNMKRGKEGSKREYFLSMKDYKTFIRKDKEQKKEIDKYKAEAVQEISNRENEAQTRINERKAELDKKEAEQKEKDKKQAEKDIEQNQKAQELERQQQIINEQIKANEIEKEKRKQEKEQNERIAKQNEKTLQEIDRVSEQALNNQATKRKTKDFFNSLQSPMQRYFINPIKTIIGTILNKPNLIPFNVFLQQEKEYREAIAIQSVKESNEKIQSFCNTIKEKETQIQTLKNDLQQERTSREKEKERADKWEKLAQQEHDKVKELKNKYEPKQQTRQEPQQNKQQNQGIGR